MKFYQDQIDTTKIKHDRTKCSQRFLCPLVFTPEMMIALGSTSPIKIVSLWLNFRFPMKLIKPPLMKYYQLKMVDKLRNGNIRCINNPTKPQKTSFFLPNASINFFFWCAVALVVVISSGVSHIDEMTSAGLCSALSNLSSFDSAIEIKESETRSCVNNFRYHLSSLLLASIKYKCITFQNMRAVWSSIQIWLMFMPCEI